MLPFLDRPGDPCGGEPLAGLLRPGNAGANTLVDQIEVAEEALEQLPAEVAAEAEIALRRLRRGPPTICSTCARGRNSLLGRLGPDQGGARGDRSDSDRRWASAPVQAVLYGRTARSPRPLS
jgi:hypothetical protein